MSARTQQVAVCHLGHTEYRAAWKLQQSLQKRLIDAKRNGDASTVPHVVLTVEHPPVYTLGKSGDRAHLIADSRQLERLGATFERIDRGGDITFHGPGQLVVYPILDLDRFYTDIHRYLRELEEAVIRTCSHFGVKTGRIKGKTGVWIHDGSGTRDRKIAAMGVKCSRWVTCHGLALNVDTDLSYFRHIVPCGIPDADVTSLSNELGTRVAIDEVLPIFVDQFRKVFAVDPVEYESDASDLFLARYLSRVNS